MKLDKIIEKMKLLDKFIDSQEFQYARGSKAETLDKKADNMALGIQVNLMQALSKQEEKVKQEQKILDKIERLLDITKHYTPDMWHYYAVQEVSE